MSWLVPELGQDFSEDFEDIIIAYIESKWTESDPLPIFKAGFPDDFNPYEVCCVQTRTEPIEKINGKWVFTTGLDIAAVMKRLDRDAIDTEPQLENMEAELQRIVEHYEPNEIVGIKDLVYDDPSTERSYNANDTWAKSKWVSMVKIKVFYEKEDLS